jgi:hypothetical protein
MSTAVIQLEVRPDVGFGVIPEIKQLVEQDDVSSSSP